MIKFFGKALLLLLATLLVWERTPLARHYHTALAACAQYVYGNAASDGVVRDVRTDGEEFAVTVFVDGKADVLRIRAEDITSNSFVLLALYLASPVHPLLSLYLRCFGAALIVLFGMHVTALYVIVRTAVAWRETAGMGRSASPVEDMGPWMYPLVVLLWAPYLLAYLRGTRRSRST